MRKKIHKWFWAWDFKKEESWLNEMAAKGLSLTAVSFCTYTFEESVPGEYMVRLELLENVPEHAESQQYMRFLEETGAEYVGAVIRWAYFRKRAAMGEFNLFSDNTSRIQHLNRLLQLLAVLSFINLGIAGSNITMYFTFHVAASLVSATIGLSVALLLGIGFLRAFKIKQGLKKELQIFE